MRDLVSWKSWVCSASLYFIMASVKAFSASTWAMVSPLHGRADPLQIGLHQHVRDIQREIGRRVARLVIEVHQGFVQSETRSAM